MKKKWFGLYKWFSICSRHNNHDESCRMCNHGRWIFIPFFWIEKLFFKISPSLWRKWKNR
jgi:hypothetical protein